LDFRASPQFPVTLLIVSPVALTVCRWANTLNGAPTGMSSSYPTLQSGRDFTTTQPMPGYTPYAYPHPLVGGGKLQPPFQHTRHRKRPIINSYGSTRPKTEE